MAQPLRSASCLAFVILAVGSVACNDAQKRLQQHQEKFESLGTTTAVVSDAWLAGHVSGTYAQTTFERVLELTEQERSALSSRPEDLRVPQGAQQSQRAERLARLLASLMRDVKGGDDAAVRRHLADIPMRAPEDR